MRSWENILELSDTDERLGDCRLTMNNSPVKVELMSVECWDSASGQWTMCREMHRKRYLDT